jgi:hypothetical protein
MYDGIGYAFAFGLVLAMSAGAALMAIPFWLIPWLWELVKPWLHMVTA